MRPKDIIAKLKTALGGNKIIIYGIKYIPIACTILLTIHMALLLLGLNESITVGAAAILILCLLVLLSFKFNFCLLHKIMIAYIALSTTFICIWRMGGEFLMNTILRIIALIVGVALITMSVKKIKGDDCCQ